MDIYKFSFLSYSKSVHVQSWLKHPREEAVVLFQLDALIFVFPASGENWVVISVLYPRRQSLVSGLTNFPMKDLFHSVEHEEKLLERGRGSETATKPKPMIAAI